MQTIRTLTLGCSKNTVDTEHILACIEGKWEILAENDTDRHCDVLLVNTCGFIGDAKQQSIDAIIEAGQLKREGFVGRLVVFGCLAQRYMKELPGLLPEVDAWFGARDFDGLLSYLGADGSFGPFAFKAPSRYLTGPSHYAFLKISEGCDRRCAYCAIPLIRGNQKSVPIEELVREAVTLASKGVKELVVVAQDTSVYGLDIYHRRALSELLKALCEVDGIEWIRVHYSYPEDFPMETLSLMQPSSKLCHYLDIPLQHISDKVLSKMRRTTTGEQIRKIISDIRAAVPDIVIRTTLMVGHPGEGKKEFEELLEFVKEARFERMGAFAYSREEGTYGALHYWDSVSQMEKSRRLETLMEAQRGISLENNQSRIGKVERVIVDECCEDGILRCRSRFESPDVDGEILLKHNAGDFGVKDPSMLVGEFINVRIVGADDYDLIAEKS